MTAFAWKGDDEGGDDFASLFGLTFAPGVPVECGHLLPYQINKLRNHPYFVEVPDEAPAPKGSPEQNERDAIKAKLDEAGIPYDKRWGLERLKAVLEGTSEADEGPAK